MSFNFANLDLTGVKPSTGGSSVPVGPNLLEVTNAELTDNKAKTGKQLMVELSMMDGSGRKCRDYITVSDSRTGENFKTAVRIGLERLRALLEFGGHPNPNNPGDISTLIGLVVGVHIEKGEDWTDESGEKKPGGGRPRKNAPYFKSDKSPTVAATSGRKPIDDGIPF